MFQLAALIALCCSSAPAADPMVRARVPDDGRIVLADYGFRDWGPELVHYTVDAARYKPGETTLLDGREAEVPHQIDGNVLAFVASVPKGTTAVYRLRTGRPQKASPLAVQAQGNELVVRNEHLTLWLPAAESRTHAEPIEAAKARPPLLGWACSDGVRMGAARFVTSRKVASEKFSLVRQGPAAVEYEARYAFVPKGEYVFRVRLSPAMPLAVVSEEFDFGLTAGEDVLMLDLHRGRQPGGVAWVPGSGEQQMPALGSLPWAEYLQKKRESKAAEAPVGGAGEAPSPFRPDPKMVLLEKILPAGRWGDAKGGIQVSFGQPAGPTIGVVPLSAGSWRRAMVLCAWHDPGAGLTLALPIGVRYSRWSLEVTDDHSPFSTHEHDPGLSPTYGRRCWGLFAGPGLNEAQARFGYIGLDRYKDWVIEYPEDATKAKYPGGFFSPAHVARLRLTLDAHPDAEFLKTWYIFSGKTEDAVVHARRVIEGLTKPYGENNFFLVGLSAYRKSQFFSFAALAEDALACPQLPRELRSELRRLLALYAHVFSDPDLNPRGSGAHLGNNNMPINRTLALTYFAGLLPDHPRYAYWMECCREFVEYKYSTEMAVDGVNIECPSYALYSPFRTLNISQNILRNRGIFDFGPSGYHERFLRWLAYLTMPDPRHKGLRILPGMGNSSNLIENVWGFSMAAEVDRDPAFAGWLRWMNRKANGNMPLDRGPNYHDQPGATPHALYYFPDVTENRQPQGTVFLPTYGVVFRHQFNTPNETALLFRAGMNWGHWDTDALNAILYGKGAPLSPGTGYQYYSGPASDNNAVYHNQLKIGRRDAQECFGRVDTTVRDYGFGPHADYAVGGRFYPSQVFGDGQGAVTWNRHVMFLKTEQPTGPSYFVFRDTLDRPGRRTWWEWMNLDGAELIRVDGKPFDPARVPQDKAVAEEQFPRLRGQTVELGTKYGASTWLWFSEPRDVCARMTFKAANEVKTIVVVPGAPGQDYFYAVYPRRDGEPAPQCQLLAPGVMRVKTPESTDTVFLADAPLAIDRDEIVFTGTAGAVRVFADRVVLCLSAGNGRIGYRGHVLEGQGPFEEVVPLGQLRPGTHRRGGEARRFESVDMGRGVRVSGEGPFTATLEGDAIRVRTTGRARVLHITQPPFIVRPRYTIDGQAFMACRTDYPNNGWGTYDETWKIGLAVPEGQHQLEIKDLTFPRGWTRPFTPTIEGVAR